jgi:CubicO group peptidase (beta-lactamase class C family)
MIARPSAHFFALTLIVLVPAVPAWGAPEIINAKITKIDPKARVVDIERKGNLYSETFTVEENAKLEMDAQRVTLADFKAGMQVTLIADIKSKRITRINGKAAPDGSKPTRRPPPKSAGGTETAVPLEARGNLPESLKEVDTVVQSFLTEQEIRGGAVVIVKDGKGVLARGYGFADKAKKIPTEPTTLFPIDGVSKVITGIVLAQLAEQGKFDPNAKFFDSLGTTPTANDDEVPDYSRFVDATTVDILKNPIRYQRDTFFKEYLEDADFRKKMNDRVKTMADGNAVELRKYVKYDVTDLQYMLLGRLIAKGAGKSYKDAVQELLLTPAGVTDAKVVLLPIEADEEEDRNRPAAPTTREKSREKRVQARKDEEKEKQQKKKELYQGIAQVQFQAGRDYEANSMSLDAAGSWCVSAIDLARIARAIDKPTETSLLKADGMKILLTPIVGSTGTDESDDEKEDKTQTRETKLKSSRYFASGWSVVRPTSDDDQALFAARRSVHSGPAAIVSENGLHIVILLTTGYAASKSGEEHPLLVELLDVASRVKEWPSKDILGPTSEEGTPDVVDNMPAEGTADTTDSRRPVLRVPVVASHGDQIEAAVTDLMKAYDKFLSGGGSKILQEIQQSAVPDFKRIAQRVPGGIAAADSLASEYQKSLFNKTVAPSTAVPADKPEQKAAADALIEYGESIARFTGQLNNALKAGSNPEQAKGILAEFHRNEEEMYGDLFKVLDQVDKAFPSEPKPAATPAEFQKAIGRVVLRINALDQKLNAFTSGRFSRIDSIQSKGGGATAEEQLQLPALIAEVQAGTTEAVTGFNRYVEIANKYVELEKGAGSKYLPAWQQVSEWASAQAAYASYFAEFGKETFNPDSEQELFDRIAAAKKRLDEARSAADNPEDAPAEVAPAAGVDPPTAATPTP